MHHFYYLEPPEPWIDDFPWSPAMMLVDAFIWTALRFARWWLTTAVAVAAATALLTP